MRGVIEYFARHQEERLSMTLIAGFKSPEDVLFEEDFKRWNERMNLILTVDGAEEGYEGRVGL